MNFRYKLMQFMSGRYGTDTLFYFLFIAAAGISFVNCFVRSIYLQMLVYAIVVYAVFRMFSRNIPARQKENRVFKVNAEKFKKWSDTKRTRSMDYTHVYKKCPNCRAVLRLPKKKGKHTTVCPKCGCEFKVRVYKDYKPL